MSVDGDSSTAQSGSGSSASRARIMVTSDRLPPAESPASANGRWRQPWSSSQR